MNSAGLRVTFLNLYHRHGGAERCLSDLVQGFRGRGRAVELVIGKSTDAAAEARDGAQLLRRPWWEWLLQRGAHRLFGVTDTLLASSFWHALRHPAFGRADVVHIHILHGSYFNLWALPLLAWRRPLVITLHDMWLLTGDCIYADGCERWQTTCGSCPLMQLPRQARGAVGGRDLTRVNLAIKRQALRRIAPERLRIVSPSRWLDDMAGRSHLGWAPRQVVPYGIELDEFAPVALAEARATLGLPAQGLLLAAVAANWDNPYKGGDLLADIAAALSKGEAGPRPATIVAAGRMSPATRQRLLERGVIVRDGLQSPDVVRHIFSACDAALVLSRQENLPFVVIESLACGCPPIGTTIGGIPEMFGDGREGWLVPAAATAADVLERVQRLAVMPPHARAEQRRAARAHAERCFSRDGMLDAYERVYRELVPAARPAAA